MDIEGVGEQFVRRLWDRGLLRSMPDLYRLTPEQLAELEGYGEISSAKAVEAVQSSKAQPFSRVLFGLNIPKTGWVMARNLARHFGSVDALLAATQVELEEVEGIGRTAPSWSPSGSQTRRTGGSSRSFAHSACRWPRARRSDRWRARSAGGST
jgi:NAD-dependent DNA ligase